MAASDFVRQLQELGYTVQEVQPGRIIVPWVIPLGPHSGKEARIGFNSFADFPQNPPGCLHISPALLPLNNQSGAHPYASVHGSDFGSDWQYWSRPINHWPQTARSARDVMAHIHHLLDTLPK